MSARILIVDDDRDHAESIADLLELRGHHAEVAGSGEAAAARFRETDFDLVFMDVKLPGMNGVETFFEFRRIRPRAQVMMMTGYSVAQLVAQAVENGALGVLHKPFAIDDLLATLEQVKPRGMVLVADDDPDFAASIVPLLAARGYSVEVARTGEEALLKAAAPGLDCLILDLRMPTLSGLEVYLRIKEAGRLIPTIFVTGFNDESDAELVRVKQLREGFLTKPFDPAVLLLAVEAAARRGAER
ncbi:MAG: response regulator receiver protein [Rhodospirillales bacterium]|nr:response regulator receiver protein [Rhodospirillales bacterium]